MPKIECIDCGEKLPEEWIGSEKKSACPKCGSSKYFINLEFFDEAAIEIHESLNGKLKDPNYSSRRNPRYEFFEGEDLRKSDGKWMQKTRIIDKYNDKYIEKVTDPETGVVIHHSEEPLSAHFGHGSDKFRKD